MAKRVSVDRWLFTVTMLLVFVGLVMVFSASAVMARERFGSPYAFLSKQLMWAAAGIAAMVVAMRVDYRRYKHPALVFSLMGVTTLLLISVFFLDRSHNTHRWIHWGGFSFQPSELAKPVLILFLAYFRNGPKIPAKLKRCGAGVAAIPIGRIGPLRLIIPAGSTTPIQP